MKLIEEQAGSKERTFIACLQEALGRTQSIEESHSQTTARVPEVQGRDRGWRSRRPGKLQTVLARGMRSPRQMEERNQDYRHGPEGERLTSVGFEDEEWNGEEPSDEEDDEEEAESKDLGIDY